jgi:hypothetical protein
MSLFSPQCFYFKEAWLSRDNERKSVAEKEKFGS